jgi:hypothetical protein
MGMGEPGRLGRKRRLAMIRTMQSLDPKGAASGGLPPRSFDNRVILHGVSWDAYERILEVRGDHGGVRLTYLKGALELMSPSNDHEYVKKTIARLVEAYADEPVHRLDRHRLVDREARFPYCVLTSPARAVPGASARSRPSWLRSAPS